MNNGAFSRNAKIKLPGAVCLKDYSPIGDTLLWNAFVVRVELMRKHPLSWSNINRIEII